MIKLIIVDDEPLVQVGIKSMINWEEMGIEISGMAHNGKIAFDLIEKHQPDIVITDIKMPIMDGLELMASCNERLEYSPVFIVLTSYEEFTLAQQALRLGALDYVIKIELTEKILKSCMEKATQEVKKKKTPQQMENYVNKDFFADKFFVRLLNMFYSSNEQIKQQLNDFSISLNGNYYLVIFCKIDFTAHTLKNEVIELYNYVIHMVEEIISRHFFAVTVPIDKSSFSVIITTNLDTPEETSEAVLSIVNIAAEMIHKYFNVILLAGIGNVYDELVKIADSYQEALQAHKHIPHDKSIASYSEIKNEVLYKNTFDISVFRKCLTLAFDEFDLDAVESIFNIILDLLSNYTSSYLQAFDACSNVMYLILTMLDCGEEILETIFSDETDGYKSIYRKNTIESLIAWLKKLRNGLIAELNKKKNNHTNYLVINVQKYIQANYKKKLALQDIADLFNISPNYLSSIFKKYSGVSFTEYVTNIKIKHAQVLIKEGQMKIYEISDYLGFDSSYYFSKVFKKITGYSPKEYAANIIIE